MACFNTDIEHNAPQNVSLQNCLYKDEFEVSCKVKQEHVYKDTHLQKDTE